MAEPHVEPHARTCVEGRCEPLSGRGFHRVDLPALKPYGSRHHGAYLSAVEPDIDVGPVGTRQQDVVDRRRGRHPRLGRIGLGVRLLLGGGRGEFLLTAGLLATGPTSRTAAPRRPLPFRDSGPRHPLHHLVRCPPGRRPSEPWWNSPKFHRQAAASYHSRAGWSPVAPSTSSTTVAETEEVGDGSDRSSPGAEHAATDTSAARTRRYGAPRWRITEARTLRRAHPNRGSKEWA